MVEALLVLRPGPVVASILLGALTYGAVLILVRGIRAPARQASRTHPVTTVSSRDYRLSAGHPIWMALRIALGLGLLIFVLEKTGGWRSVAQLFSVPWLVPGFVLFTLVGAAVEARRLSLLLRSQRRELPFAPA